MVSTLAGYGQFRWRLVVNLLAKCSMLLWQEYPVTMLT